MDVKRAREIASSPVMANVTYYGTPIYINGVNSDGTVTIHPLGECEKKQQVPLTSLVENEADKR